MTPPHRQTTSHFAAALLAAALSLVANAGARANDEAPAPLVASIQPLHSLVQGVVGDTETVVLLTPGGASPHTTHLKPSQVRQLHAARAVFYISPEFETFLARILKALPAEKTLALMSASLPTRLPVRTGAPWEQDHGHAHDHAHGHAHEAGRMDAHIWLDPENAAHIVRTVERKLAAVNPQRRDTYAANANRLVQNLKTLDEELKRQLAPVRKRPFIVLHDAYQYLEHRYGLNAVGSVIAAADRPLSPGRIASLRNSIRQTGAVCIFHEPQLPGKTLSTFTEDLALNSGVLDPLGATHAPGADAYFQTLKQLAATLRECLSAP